MGAGGRVGFSEQGSEVVGGGIGIVCCSAISGLSFSRTVMRSFPNSPGLSQFSASRQSGRLRGHPVPHTLSQEHSTSILSLVLSKVVFNFEFWSNLASRPLMHSDSACFIH